ncbi:hypothetical protein F0M18_01200 [Pseudohalioglobus sediminis]|uniref:DUF1311 domain-containing protein n=1 Tax=Pseudohalioglobus sediminis TaxID=2606449 RepID=A0A5B0X781_9GAMM|nr:hypothetical protein [Pseudohalioglobus sediminis]KAA1194089.1 hypothetical protein F0M18_01200 [Pseudohalioglobus sediminis]
MARAAAALCLTIAVVTVSGPVRAQDAPLWQCQQWQDKIDYYTDLRRKGGSVRDLESWKQARAEYEEKFKDAGCRKHAGLSK